MIRPDGRSAAGTPLHIGEDHVVAILVLIRLGWKSAMEHSEVSPQTLEVDLNAYLRQGMCDVVDANGVRFAPHISVFPGTESTKPGEVVPSGRTDISIILHHLPRRHDPHTVIECKKVSGAHARHCRRYVVDGIDDRFKSGKYAKNDLVAFMTGFVFAGTIGEAVACINRHLIRKKRGDELLNDSTVGERRTRTSRHSRCHVEENIELHHAFVSFDSAGA